MEEYIEKATNGFHKITDKLASFVTGCGALIIAFIVFCIFFEVVGRYFGTSRAFLQEIPRMMVAWLIFPMMGVLYKAERHISVDVLPERLSPKFNCVLKLVVSAIVLGVAIQLTYAGIMSVAHFKMMGLKSVTEFEIPMWIFYLVFPIAFGLLGLFALESITNQAWKLYKILTKKQSG